MKKKKKKEHSKKQQKPRKKHHLNLKAETGMICLQANESQHTFPVLLPPTPVHRSWEKPANSPSQFCEEPTLLKP